MYNVLEKLKTGDALNAKEKAIHERGLAVAVLKTLRFGSAANLNIHLHCLVLDGVYRRTEGEPDF